MSYYSYYNFNVIYYSFALDRYMRYAIITIVNETLTEFFENQILEVMMLVYTYKLDGEFFDVQKVYLDENNAIIACGRYPDGIWDEARAEDLEIHCEFVKEEE